LYFSHRENVFLVKSKAFYGFPRQSPPEPHRAHGRPHDWSGKTAQNTLKSLDRAMEVFEFLSEHQGKALTLLAAALPHPDHV